MGPDPSIEGGLIAAFAAATANPNAPSVSTWVSSLSLAILCALPHCTVWCQCWNGSRNVCSMGEFYKTFVLKKVHAFEPFIIQYRLSL
jgi:hypothetical protein